VEPKVLHAAKLYSPIICGRVEDKYPAPILIGRQAKIHQKDRNIPSTGRWDLQLFHNNGRCGLPPPGYLEGVVCFWFFIGWPLKRSPEYNINIHKYLPKY